MPESSPSIPLESASSPGGVKTPVRWLVIALLTLAVLADTFNHLGVQLLRDDLFAGDAGQHTWWVYRFADASLFPDDLAAAYYGQYVYSPPGYQAFFRLLTPLIDAQRLAEGLAIVLNLVGAWLAWHVGRRIGTSAGGAVGGFAGATAGVLVWIFVQSPLLVEGGFPRSFGMPLLLAGLLAILARRWVMLGIVTVGIALLYPPIVLNLAPVAGVIWLADCIRTRRPPRGVIALAGCGVMAVAIVALTYLRPIPEAFGPFVSYDEARQLPEWGRDGRISYFKTWRSFFFHNSTSGIGLTLVGVLLSLLGLAATVVWHRRAIPLEAWLLLGGALLTWAAAHAMAFRLYLPSRYTAYALPAFAMLWAAGVMGVGVRWTGAEDARTPRGRRLRLAALAVFAVLCVLVVIRSTEQAADRYRGPATWGMSPAFVQAMEVIRSMPADVRLASHPYDARAIPLLARRSVLVSHETAIPFNVNYWAEMKRRTRAAFDMLYATDWPTIDAIADREGVQMFVLDRRRLLDPEAYPYKEPFESENRVKIEHGRIDGFAMLSPSDTRVVLSLDEVVVLAVGSRRR